MSVAARQIGFGSGAGGGPGPGPSWSGLYFEAEEPGCIVNMQNEGVSYLGVSLEYSLDGVTWNTFDADSGNTPITLYNVGDRVYFRAGPGGNNAFGDGMGFLYFTLSARAGAYGNIMSLLKGEGFENYITLDEWGNQYAFYCLFNWCEKLTHAPELPATTLSFRCYDAMFAGCTSLTVAPDLPAVDATSSGYGCYQSMFSQCTSLQQIRVSFSDWPYGGFYNWLYGVPGWGTFICPAALDTSIRDAAHVPAGWNVVNI